MLLKYQCNYTDSYFFATGMHIVTGNRELYNFYPGNLDQTAADKENQKNYTMESMLMLFCFACCLMELLLFTHRPNIQIIPTPKMMIAQNAIAPTIGTIFKCFFSIFDSSHSKYAYRTTNIKRSTKCILFGNNPESRLR